MAKCLVDTNVLIGILRGDAKLSDLIDSLNCAIDTTVYVELIQGAKNKSDVEQIEIALTEYELIHFNNAVLLFADAVIAATCLENNLELITFNSKDFRFIKGLIKGLKFRVPNL